MKKIAAAALFTMLVSPAFAGDAYILGSVGQAKMNIDQGALDNAIASVTGSVSSSVDETDIGYKLQLGYQFNPYLAVEGGYVNLGKAKYSATFTGGTLNAESKATGWNIAAVGILPINDAFSLFGKLGTIDARVKANVTASGPAASESASASSTDWKFTWGIGAAYNINKQFSVRAEYEQFKKLGNNDTTGEADVKLLSAGLIYKF